MEHNNNKNLMTQKFQKIDSFWLYFIPFVLLSVPVLIQVLTDNLPEVNGYYTMHYVLTYDHGYVGRGLIGEILSWFFDTMTMRTINICNVIFTEILVVVASLCIGKALNKSRKNENEFFTVFYLILFLCLAEFTVGTYYTDIKMDKLIWALTLLSVLVSDNKVLHFFIPVFAVVSILINPVFCFTGFVLVVIVLFDKFQKSSYSFKAGFLLAATCVLVVFIIGYATIAQTHLGFKDADEFMDFYFARFEGSLSQRLRERFSDEWLFEYFIESVPTLLKDTFNTYFIERNSGAETIISTLFLAIPSFGIMSVFWSRVMKAEEDKFRKFIYFICLVAYLAFMPALILAWEAAKYYGCYLLVQLVLVIYFINQNDKSVITVVDELKEKIKAHPMVFASVAGYFITALMVKSK